MAQADFQKKSNVVMKMNPGPPAWQLELADVRVFVLMGGVLSLLSAVHISPRTGIQAGVRGKGALDRDL